MLRHVCGLFLAEQEYSTQDYLGHKDIKNTVIYTETSQRRLSAVRVGLGRPSHRIWNIHLNQPTAAVRAGGLRIAIIRMPCRQQRGE